jgi:hypothetical protein
MTPNKLKLIAVITLVTMVAAACTSPGGSTQLKTGAVQTQTISVPLPPDTSKPVDVTLRLGAAELTAGSGAAKLAEGTVQYNVPEFQPSVSQSGNKVDITQGPTGGFQGVLPKDLVNKWNIKLSNSVPLNLVVQAGAYSGSWDLGGLRLQSLKWDEGASKSTITFDQANPDKAETFDFTTGASTVKLTGLANLNFGKMTFQSGLGSYTLDFGGKLKRSADVEIKTGVSNVTIVVPVGTSARITLKSAVSNTKTIGSWNSSGSTYTTGKDDAADKLNIAIDMGLGQLTLDTH